MVKNPPPNAGDVGLISGWETKIPYAAVQLSTHFSNKNPVQPKKKKKAIRAAFIQSESSGTGSRNLPKQVTPIIM